MAKGAGKGEKTRGMDRNNASPPMSEALGDAATGLPDRLPWPAAVLAILLLLAALWAAIIAALRLIG